MARRAIPESRLVSIINEELARLEACPGCRIDGVVPLEAPDEEGCNWADPEIRCEGFRSGSLCDRAAERVMGWAKARFELKTT